MACRVCSPQMPIFFTILALQPHLARSTVIEYTNETRPFFVFVVTTLSLSFFDLLLTLPLFSFVASFADATRLFFFCFPFYKLQLVRRRGQYRIGFGTAGSRPWATRFCRWRGANGVIYRSGIVPGGCDRVRGGCGCDRVSGGCGCDRVRGGCGCDRVRGGCGYDRVRGGCSWGRVSRRLWLRQGSRRL